MSNGIYQVPVAINEPVLNYAPGSPERASIKAALKKMRSEVRDIPMYIDGKAVRSEKQGQIRPPHDHQAIVGNYHVGNKSHVEAAAFLSYRSYNFRVSLSISSTRFLCR